MNELDGLVDALHGLPAAVRHQYQRARSLISPQQMNHAIDQLAVRLTLMLQDRQPLLLEVAPAGPVLSGRLSGRMVFPCERLLVGVVEGEVVLLPSVPLAAARTVVLLGGVADEPDLQTVRAWALAAGATDVYQVAVTGGASIERNLTAVSGLPQIIDRVFPDRDGRPVELFGSGLSYNGFGHNLAGLYATMASRMTSGAAT